MNVLTQSGIRKIVISNALGRIRPAMSKRKRLQELTLTAEMTRAGSLTRVIEETPVIKAERSVRLQGALFGD